MQRLASIGWNTIASNVMKNIVKISIHKKTYYIVSDFLQLESTVGNYSYLYTGHMFRITFLNVYIALMNMIKVNRAQITFFLK